MAFGGEKTEAGRGRGHKNRKESLLNAFQKYDPLQTRIPDETTSRPAPAIFKVDVSCVHSRFFSPFASFSAVISNLARESSVHLAAITQSHTHGCIGEVVVGGSSYPLHTRSFILRFCALQIPL